MDNAPLPQPKPDQVKPHPRRARGRLWRKAVKRTPTILQMEAVECGAARNEADVGGDVDQGDRVACSPAAVALGAVSRGQHEVLGDGMKAPEL